MKAPTMLPERPFDLSTPLMKVVSVTAGSTGDVASTKTATITKTGLNNQTGYTAKGIVGVQTTSSALVVYRMTIDSSTTATVSARNIASSTQSATVTIHVLYVRSDLL